MDLVKIASRIANSDNAKARAMEYVNSGDLKGAIDSLVSDIDKETDRHPMQKQMLGMMGMELRNKPGLTKAEVLEFIQSLV